MKKIYYLMLLLVVGCMMNANAQVAIGTSNDPHPGAILELKSNNTRGFLLPQVILTSAWVWTPLGGSPVDGMMVFNLNASVSNDLGGSGVYIWMNNRWRLSGVKDISVTNISISPASRTINVGGSFSLTVTFNPSDATNKYVRWVSGNTAVATVDSNGTVSAVGVGTASIIAVSVDGAKISICTVNVH